MDIMQNSDKNEQLDGNEETKKQPVLIYKPFQKNPFNEDPNIFYQPMSEKRLVHPSQLFKPRESAQVKLDQPTPKTQTTESFRDHIPKLKIDNDNDLHRQQMDFLTKKIQSIKQLKFQKQCEKDYKKYEEIRELWKNNQQLKLQDPFLEEQCFKDVQAALKEDAQSRGCFLIETSSLTTDLYQGLQHPEQIYNLKQLIEIGKLQYVAKRKGFGEFKSKLQKAMPAELEEDHISQLKGIQRFDTQNFDWDKLQNSTKSQYINNYLKEQEEIEKLCDNPYEKFQTRENMKYAQISLLDINLIYCEQFAQWKKKQEDEKLQREMRKQQHESQDKSERFTDLFEQMKQLSIPLVAHDHQEEIIEQYDIILSKKEEQLKNILIKKQGNRHRMGREQKYRQIEQLLNQKVKKNDPLQSVSSESGSKTNQQNRDPIDNCSSAANTSPNQSAKVAHKFNSQGLKIINLIKDPIIAKELKYQFSNLSEEREKRVGDPRLLQNVVFYK